MSAGAIVGRDAREAEVLELGRAVAGFGRAALFPRDGSDPRDDAIGVVESSEDSEDEVEDSMNSGDFCLVAGTTAILGAVVGSGSTGSVADTSDTDSSL